MNVRPIRASESPEREGDGPVPADFRKIYESYFDYVWRCVRRLGVSAEQLDDATQDVFMVVSRRLESFEGRSSLRTWIYGVALRVARDYRRRAERRARIEPLGPETVDPRPGPLDSATTSEALNQVLAVLARLDDDKREVFVLSEMEQMTAPEISDVLNIPINTVYSRLRAARVSFVSVADAFERSER